MRKTINNRLLARNEKKQSFILKVSVGQKGKLQTTPWSGSIMKAGDLVRVSFPTGYEKPVLGVYLRDDIVIYGVATRALILWEGQIYSTPLDQMEVISESI
jgi:hypothetical protein